MIRLAILLCVVASAQALTCAPCHAVRCKAPENCPKGTVKGMCGCCDVCAKVEGEECGGPWNIAGVCAEGLMCEKPEDDFNVEGICKESSEIECGENAHFDGCGHGACQPTCDNPAPICTLQCIPGCQCDEGFVLHGGKCMAADQCPDRKCPEHSHFRQCGGCLRTCENPNPICTRECKPPRCHCDSGYLWSKGSCVPRSQCGGCVKGDDYYPNGAKWADETEGTNCMCLERQAVCTPIDRSQCPRDSHVGLTWGRQYPLWTCIIGPREKTVCQRQGEPAYAVDFVMRCGEYGLFETTQTDPDTGLRYCVHPVYGTVYRETENQPGDKEMDVDCATYWRTNPCGRNAHFHTCGVPIRARDVPHDNFDMCQASCDHPSPICEEICIPSCRCDKGFVLHEGKCVNPKECPDRKCPENSHFRQCGKGGCQATCEEPHPICHAACIPSCHCNRGYVWREGGCVPISQCGGCVFDDGQYYPNGAKWASDKVGINCMCLQSKVVCAPINKSHCPVYSRVETSAAGSHIIWTCVKETTTKCERERELAVTSGLMDAFVKQCGDDGSYLPLQCYGFTGECYCAHPHTGTLYQETRALGKPPADCSTYWKSQGGKTGEKPKTKCETERDSAPRMPGLFVKACHEKGAYRVVQCHGSSGYCFCANPTDGSVFDETGRRGEPDRDCQKYWEEREAKTKCERERDEALADIAMGAQDRDIPGCTEDGLYKTRQCIGMIGVCYCVHPTDGTAYRETQEKMGPDGWKYDCDNYWKTAGEKTKCQRERAEAEADLAAGMVGLFVKTCAEDGSYETRQCHASTGYCYCAHPADGTTYRETGVRVWETEGAGFDCDNYWKTADEGTTRDEL